MRSEFTASSTRVDSPVEANLKWAGASNTGHFKYWDGSAEVAVKTMTFVPLAQRQAVAGWSEKDNTTAWSNEVEDLREEPLSVKVRVNDEIKVIAEGLYADIKESLKELGVKYHRHIFGLVVDSDSVEPGTVIRIALKGGASFAWSNFLKSGGASNGVKVAGFEDKKKGAVQYRVPVFQPYQLTPDEESEAQEAEAEVDAYLDSRKPAPVSAVEHVAQVFESDAPF